MMVWEKFRFLLDFKSLFLIRIYAFLLKYKIYQLIFDSQITILNETFSYDFLFPNLLIECSIE